MSEGLFKGWKTGTSYGFIRIEGTEDDAFVLKKDSNAPDTITPGSRVSFDLEKGERGWVAKNLVAIELAPVNEAPVIETSSSGPRMRGRLRFWSDQKGFGLLDSDQAEGVFLRAAELKRIGLDVLQAGDLIEFSTQETERGKSAYAVERVGWEKVRNSFADLVQFRNRDWKPELKELAEKENWEFSSGLSNTALPVLDSYLKYTFMRLEETNKLRLSKDEKFMSFNTGLVTPNQESIYGLLEKSEAERIRPWLLRKFVRESDWDFITRFGSDLPPLAEYFVESSDLLYDRRFKLYPNIDHILENADRFPKNLQGNPFLARQLLTSAQVNTEKRVYRNYKTAIPQFFRDKGKGGKLQLLLPLCLEDPSRADLALTVEKIPSENAYLSSTVLTLDMAYCNARLLARPDTEWLRP